MSDSLTDPGIFRAGEALALGNILTIDITPSAKTVKLADGAVDEPFALAKGVSLKDAEAKIATGDGKMVRFLLGGTVTKGDTLQPGTAASKGKAVKAATSGKLVFGRAFESGVDGDIVLGEIVRFILP